MSEATKSENPNESTHVLSVIIPAFNEEAVIRSTLGRIENALAENSEKGLRWEIIVCDNNSTDKTAEIASQLGARVVAEPVNQISRARNTGAGMAQGDWLLFIDADSYPSSELIAEVLDVMASEKYIGCGCTFLVKGGTLLNKLRLERANPFLRLFRLCGGAFILCRSDAFRSIKGFSTALFAMEEIEFVIRLKRYGRRQGKRFAILRHPVVTSGRKGDYGVRSVATMFIGEKAAVLLLLLSFVLPRRLMPKTPTWLLNYWYDRRR